MDLSHILIGPIVTEKAERMKAQGPRHTYTVQVAPAATKIEVKKALARFYDVQVENVRMMRIRPKQRAMSDGRTMEKRHASKRAFITLAAKSKPLDLASFASRA